VTVAPARVGRSAAAVGAVGVVTMAIALALAAATIGSGAATAAASASGLPPVPLATSIQSSAGTWATVPMGHLRQPLNTFWQLLYRPAGATAWSNQVQATATATNGGLVLAAAPGQPFIAGVRPADLLRFSPLIATADGGRTWSDGLVPKGLAATPDSLATVAEGPTLALVGRGLGSAVLTSTGTLSGWRTLITARSLAAGAAGKACGVEALLAVASQPGRAIIGARCSEAGVVGLFAVAAGSGQLVSVHLPAALQRGRVQVLGLETTASGLSALLAVAANGSTVLATAQTTAGGAWVVSSGLALPSGLGLASFGPTTGTGYFALLTGSSGRARRLVEDGGGTGAAWQRLSTPPPGTDTVAFDPAVTGSADALAVDNSTVTVWTLSSPSGAWTPGQVLHVQIKFGSSS
jgi:hypothetical protein